jgi:pimeloyl-ACP methyl ester carboxylesterase
VIGTGPPVVLLHGQPGSGTDWILVARRLATDFEVVTPDRPGWGRTGGPAGGFARNAEAVVELLDRLGRERVIVAGHSWAGGVALALALDHADRVAGVVLVASVAPGQPVSLGDRALGAPGIGDIVVPAAFGFLGRVLTLSPARRLLGRSAPGLTGVALLAAVGEAADLSTPAGARPRPGDRHGDGGAGDGICAWAAPGAGGNPRRPRGTHRAVGHSFTVEQRAYLSELGPFAARLSSITAPVEVITGDSDHVVAPRVARHLTAAIPTAVLREVSGAGHLLLLDHPDEVEAAVREAGRRARWLE